MDNIIKEILNNVRYGNTNARETVALLSEKDQAKLRYTLPQTVRALADISDELEELRRDKFLRYDLMVKQARKRFDEADILMLEKLSYDDYSWCADAFITHIKDESPDSLELSKSVVLRKLRRLKRLGLVTLVRGLFNDDDGMAAGSGWSLNYRRHQIVSDIIKSYRGDTDQTELEI